MIIHQLRREQIVYASMEACWAFFSNPHNLRELTPAWMDFTVTSDTPARMYPGMIISYRIRPLLGIPQTWVTEITHVDEGRYFVDEGRYFVDEQRFGPYRMWHHQHHFKSLGDGRVRMTDIVDYVMPLGPVGNLVHRLYIAKQLREVFDYRIRAVDTLFPAPEAMAGPQAAAR